jgi:hypothetical protein
VAAVDREGVESDFSDELNVLVNIVRPGQNMVQNGDFSQGQVSWNWTLGSGAAATWVIENGVSRVNITAGTSSLTGVQLRQTGKPLVNGNKYVFEFDGWSSSARYIEAKVARDSGSPNYSGSASSFLTPVPQHYRYVFTMTAATDLNASVFFNLGSALSAHSVYLDNVALFQVAPGDLNTDGRVDLLDLESMSNDWLKQQAGLAADLNGDGRVDFKDFGMMGENWTAP